MPDQIEMTLTYKPPFKVKITYFKSSGKYYSNGSYMSDKLHLFEIFEEVNEMLENGKRPGLVDGHDYFYALIKVPKHPHNHPHLHIPTYKETGTTPLFHPEPEH